jgi:hypothetical protein
MPRKRSPFTLTERDRQVLHALAVMRGVPLEILAYELFLFDPFTGKRNTNPLRACERRLRELAGERYVRIVREYDGRESRRVVVLDTRARNHGIGADRIGGSPTRRRPPVRCGAHHVRTVDALTQIRKEIEQRGGKVLSITLDSDLRAASRKGRRTVRGQRYDLLPDAVLKIELPGRGIQQIALEYVTSKYSDADIREKRAAFQRFDRAIWVADRQRTAERVRALTGAPCRVLD